MFTEGENNTASSSGAATALSQNRPILTAKSFAAQDSEEWDSWLAHFEDFAEIKGWNPAQRAQFLGVRRRGAALLQLQSIPATVRANYDNLKPILAKICPTRTNRNSQGRVLRAASRKRPEALGSVEFFAVVG